MACAANLPCDEDVDAPLPLSPADLDSAVRCLLAAVRAPGLSTVRPRPPLTLDVLGLTVDTRLRVTPNLSGPDVVVVLEPVLAPDLEERAAEAAAALLALDLAASLLLAAADAPPVLEPVRVAYLDDLAADAALALDLALDAALALFLAALDLLLLLALDDALLLDLDLDLLLGGIMLLLI